MQWTTNKVRSAWLNFFKTKEHHILPSSSLVPNDDPSLLWINSGVANLKPYFEGKLNPPSLRLVNSQKAIRTNDIENVGFTSRHHTFFEMLGSFSIGDYFKEEAILWAWEFLTSKKWLNFDPKKLYVTIFEEDQETYNLWVDKIKIPKDHIILGTKLTNFWDMGTGPCGPNTEIYYDRGVKYDPKKIGLKLLIDDVENDRYIEIWNIVFSQFNNDGFNNYTPLPRKNIDTGAGLERIITILQDVPTNFDTDLFQAIIKKCQTLTKYRYDRDNYFKENQEQKQINISFKIISDHIRCLTFAISDGVFPSSKTRGYILRRLIRRAAIYGRKLEINKPFLSLLVPTVVQQMINYYPELQAKEILIMTIIKNEEIKFWQTLLSGEQLLLKIMIEEKIVSAKNAFKLFDTFGFPIELTQELAQQQNITIDLVGFKKLLDEHKENARAAQQDVKALQQQNPLLINLPIKSTFVGYTKEEINDGRIIFLFKDNQEYQSLENTNGYLILDQTPFYAEKGGQAADSGQITNDRAYAKIVDVQSVANLTIHYVDISGKLTKHDFVNAKVDHLKRFYTKKNHSGTHLLHAALRKILGTHVMQAGSFNNEKYLRLDFSHYQKISETEILQLETQVEQWINTNTVCEILYLSHDQAVKMNALAFFGEKYETIVRVVKFGDFSIELCGGTHCTNTKEVEDLLITSIDSKGSGNYRVQALTSFKTINNFLVTRLKDIKMLVEEIRNKYLLKIKKIKKDPKIEKHFLNFVSLKPTKQDWRRAKDYLFHLQNDFYQWQKDVSFKLAQKEQAKYLNLKPELTKNNNYLLTYEFNDLNINTLKSLSDHYRNIYKNLVIIFLNHLNATNETLILIAISKELADTNYHAKSILLTILNWFSGKGGGTNLLGQGKIEGIIKTKDIIDVVASQI